MGGLNFPLLSDFWPHGQVAEQYGVLRSEGYSERAVFIIDKSGVVRYVDIHEISEAPNPQEVLQALEAISEIIE